MASAKAPTTPRKKASTVKPAAKTAGVASTPPTPKKPSGARAKASKTAAAGATTTTPALAATAAPGPGKPVPPASHLPTIKTVDPGVWYRVHDFDATTGKYAADAFNDSGRGNARFSPLRRVDGTVIPTIYAAAHKRTAIAEILLHEAPTPSTGWIFEWSKVSDPLQSNKHLSTVQLPALKLAALTTFGLQAAGLLIEDLLGGNQPEYPRTQSWALWLYENMPDIQGLYWMSRRDNEYGCLMLFGDRVSGLKTLSTSHIAAHERAVFSTLISMNAGIS